MQRIKLKSLKEKKSEKADKILEEMVAKLDENNQAREDPVIEDQGTDQGSLGIDEEEVKEFSSESENSECEEAAEYTPQDKNQANETEIKTMIRHLYGILDNQQTYKADKAWDKYVVDAETALTLVLNLICKNYFANQGQNENCAAINLSSAIDPEDPKIKDMIKTLDQPLEFSGKFLALERRLEVVYKQNMLTCQKVDNMQKLPLSNKNKIVGVQGQVDNITNILKNNNPEGKYEVTRQNLVDLETNMDAKMTEKAAKRYPFGHQVELKQLIAKEGDLNNTEMLMVISAAITFSDNVVGVVIFEILGINIKEPLPPKIFSDFIKNLATPLHLKEPESKIKQSLQYTKVYETWGNLMKFLVNPGSLNASSIIEQTRLFYFALKDIGADKLPVGVKTKNLGFLCMVPEGKLHKNSHILEKVMELRPKLPANKTWSFDPWPKTVSGWSQGMKNWAGELLPKFRSDLYTDVCMQNDTMSTFVSQKEYASTADYGNKRARLEITKKSQRVDQNNSHLGTSGVSMWDLCTKNNLN